MKRKIAICVILLILSVSIIGVIYLQETNKEKYQIAIIRPVFSKTAFQDSFYPFFRANQNLSYGEFTTDRLELLNVTVIDELDDWSFSDGIRNTINQFNGLFESVIFDANITYLSDVDIHEGHNLTQYDLVIIGFEEYVSQRMYDAYFQYVSGGGTLLVNDACTFLCEVDYKDGYMWLVNGKGFAFNGTHAWKSIYHRWPEENRNWLGSNFRYLKYGFTPWNLLFNDSHVLNTPFSNEFSTNYTSLYKGHEENFISNMSNTEIIAYWHDPDPRTDNTTIAIYRHKYRKGSVFHMGIMYSKVMYRDLALLRLFVDVIRYLLTNEIAPWEIPTEANIQAKVSEYHLSLEALKGII